MTAIQLIRAAIQALESMPCGFVGQGGATQKELDAMVASNDVEDGVYFNSQQAFLYLQEALAKLHIEKETTK